jgi:hypothetical protein
MPVSVALPGVPYVATRWLNKRGLLYGTML